jgi:uncharacterized membrane protein
MGLLTELPPMSRTQFMVLNVIAMVLAVLVLGNLLLAQKNQALRTRVDQHQATVLRAQQADALLRQITVRIARGSDQDPELRKLLQRYELKAVLVVDGKERRYP